VEDEEGGRRKEEGGRRKQSQAKKETHVEGCESSGPRACTTAATTLAMAALQPGPWERESRRRAPVTRAKVGSTYLQTEQKSVLRP
jgi:hypothetical protein